jgi:methyl-accepting chemotaxis protein
MIVLGRRRAFLVSRALQLRLGLAAAALAILLLVPLNLALDAATRASSQSLAADAPALARPLEERDRWQSRLVLGGSIILALSVFVLGVLEGHRTAGAERKIAQAADAVADGRLDARVRLRRGDALHALADRFNGMATALARRAEEDERELERAAWEIERLASPHSDALAARLRAIAQRSSAGSGTPASANPLARSTQASHALHGRPSLGS